MVDVERLIKELEGRPQRASDPWGFAIVCAVCQVSLAEEPPGAWACAAVAARDAMEKGASVREALSRALAREPGRAL